MNKKAQGLSLNMIVVAVIVLIVLVVIIAIFSGKLGNWGGQVDTLAGDATKNCADLGTGAEVMDSLTACNEENGHVVAAKDTLAIGKVCCVT